MFRPPHGCTAVEGKVSARGLCDYSSGKPSASFTDDCRAEFDRCWPWLEASLAPSGMGFKANIRSVHAGFGRRLDGKRKAMIESWFPKEKEFDVICGRDANEADRARNQA